MKLFLFLTVAFLVALSVVAWKIQPDKDVTGKISLVWVTDDAPYRRGQIDLFNRLHPRHHLKLDPASGAEKVIVQSIGGVGPDLFDCYDAFQLSAYVKSGVAWDITEELRKMGINPKKDVWSVAHPLIEYNGRFYGFPTNIAVNCIWFNKDIFDKEGVPYPSGPMSWDEFIPIAQKLTKRDSRGRIIHFGLLVDSWNWPMFVMQWGGSMYSPSGARCVLDSPEAIAAIQFMHDLIYKYRISPSPVEEVAMATQGGWGSGSITLFGGGKLAMAVGGRWWLGSLRQYKGLRLGAFEPPHGKNRVFLGYGRATLINKDSPRRNDALLFMKYMSEAPYNQLINDQADGIAPVIKYSYTPRFLHNPAHPEEDYNAVWRDTLKYAKPVANSPFVNGQVALRILNRQLDLVRTNQKSASAAMRTAAREINKEIEKTVKNDPTLQEAYEKALEEDSR